MRLMWLRRLAVSFALAVPATSIALAQAPAVQPDFSGVWVMDTTKSQPGPNLVAL